MRAPERGALTPYDSVRPIDRADAAPTDSILRDLCRALTPSSGEKPEIHIELSPSAWEKVRTYYRRPYRPEPREFRVGVEGGTVWLYSPGARQRAWEKAQRRRGSVFGWVADRWRALNQRLLEGLARQMLSVGSRMESRQRQRLHLYGSLQRGAPEQHFEAEHVGGETFSLITRPSLDTEGHAAPPDTDSTYKKWTPGA